MDYTLFVIMNVNHQYLTANNTWVDFFDTARFFTNAVTAHTKASAVCGAARQVNCTLV